MKVTGPGNESSLGHVKPWMAMRLGVLLLAGATCTSTASQGPREPAHDSQQTSLSDSSPQSVGRTEVGPKTATSGTDNRGANGSGPAPSVTAADCEALLDHFMDIASAAHARNVAPDLVPTAEQLARIRADMAPEFLPACRKLDRATYDCEMKARTREALLACSQDAAP